MRVVTAGYLSANYFFDVLWIILLRLNLKIFFGIWFFEKILAIFLNLNLDRYILYFFHRET